MIFLLVASFFFDDGAAETLIVNLEDQVRRRLEASDEILGKILKFGPTRDWRFRRDGS